MDIIYNIYSGPSRYINLLDYSKLYLGTHQGSKTPFYYKEEIAIKSFNAWITALFLSLLPPNIRDCGIEAVNN